MGKTKNQKNKKSSFEVADIGQFHSSYTLHNKDQRIVVIMLSDLKLRFIQYRRNVLRSQVIVPLTAVIAYWVPFFTSDFKSIAGIDPDTVRGSYFMLGLIVSLLTAKNILSYAWENYILKFFPNRRIKEGITLSESRRSESDPEKYAECLCEEYEDQ